MHLPTYNNNNIVALSSLELQYYETEVYYIDNCNLKKVKWISRDKCLRSLYKYCCSFMEKVNPKISVINTN